ncbi:MAG: hypothetical protein JKX78_14730 [Alteromonadaceae bacterium]|nr:hypothetical protein [Alteromonadaceae bacterium]
MANKYSINLLQAELIPQTPLLSLNRVLMFFLALLLLMFMVIGLGQYKLSTSQNFNRQLLLGKNQQQLLQTNLSLQLSQRKADPQLVEQLQTLKLLIANKQVLHENLTDNSKTYVAGFAKTMTELAQIHQNDISLQNIVISHDDISFSGLARTPDAVPLWMANFKQASLLSGKYFSHFKLFENKQHVTEFVVSSNAPSESLGSQQ